MKCPRCGFENPNDSRFCMSCGFDLFPEGSVVCPKCGKVLPKDSMFCDNCGLKIAEQDEGKVVQNHDAAERISAVDEKDVKDAPSEEQAAQVSVQNVPSSQAAAKSSSSSSKYLIIGLIAAVLILGIALFAVLGNGNKAKEQPASEPRQEEVQDETNADNEASDATVAEAGETDLKVIDSGYSAIDGYSDKPDFNYGLEYKNTSDKLAIGAIDIRVTCRDKDGGVIDTYDGYSVTCLEPGEIGCFAQSCGEISEKPADVTIDFTFTPAEDEGYPYADGIDKVEVTGTKIKKGDTFSEIVGDVENNSKKKLSYASIHILFKDDKGKILGGDEIYVDKLREGKNAFSYDLLSTNIVTDDYTCYGVGQAD